MARSGEGTFQVEHMPCAKALGQHGAQYGRGAVSRLCGCSRGNKGREEEGRGGQAVIQAPLGCKRTWASVGAMEG